MFSHRFLFLQRCSPTDFTDLHRTFAEKTPTDFTHRSYGAFKGGCTCLKCTNIKMFYKQRQENSSFFTLRSSLPNEFFTLRSSLFT